MFGAASGLVLVHRLRLAPAIAGAVSRMMEGCELLDELAGDRRGLGWLDLATREDQRRLADALLSGEGPTPVFRWVVDALRRREGVS